MIEVQKVSLQIKKAKILENVDFTCQKGQICGVVGRNGSGKTMLMKCICGFVKPTSGEIQVDGQVIGKDIDLFRMLESLLKRRGLFLIIQAIKICSC